MDSQTIRGLFPTLLSPRSLGTFLVALALLLLAARELPWQLDDYDQAKQAYASYEIARGGHWIAQHTPDQHVATKPPLLAWISLALRSIPLVTWDLAWRIPSLAAALFILAALHGEGCRIWAPLGGLVAVAAFAFNLLTPRIATLVRTDMPLAALCLAAGLLLSRKVESPVPWTPRERVSLALILAAALLLKGPIILLFLLPGIAAFLLLANGGRIRARQLTGGWTPWLLALVPFLAWAIGLALTHRAFLDEVVVAEFLQRFKGGPEAVHKSQPIFFYALHLAHKFAPWSILLVALPALDRDARAALRRDPASLWLLCWVAASFVAMSLIPSKRVDRIFPILPPLCLLLVRMLAAIPPPRARRWRAITLSATALAAVAILAYATREVTRGFLLQGDALARFGEECRLLIERERLRATILLDEREGLLLYSGLLRPSSSAAIRDGWKRGAIDGVILPERQFARMLPQLSPARVRRVGRHVDPAGRETVYLFVSPAGTAAAPPAPGAGG